MKAFHGDESFKAEVLKEVAWHREQDKLIHNSYGELSDGDDFKGCAVGCTLRSVARIKGIKQLDLSRHGEYETLLGIPRILAKLEDVIFEKLNNGVSQSWPERFLSAINVGSDLSLVWPRFAVWLLIDETDGQINHANTEELKKVIRDVADLWQRVVDGESVELLRDKFEAAANAAAYAANAANAAAYEANAAAYAANAAANAAANEANAAANAANAAAYEANAANAAANAAANEAHWIKMSEKLLSLIAECK